VIRLTKIITDTKYWEIQDPKKMGFIPVYFRNEVRWARPVLNTHEIRIPTKEWISKYGDSLGIYVQESIIEGISTLWWLGFCLFENNSLNAEFDDEYPYLKILHFDESWIELCSSKENKRRWEIKSLETDYSSLKIDSSNKIFSLNNRTINGIHFSKDETIILEDKLLSLGAFGSTEPAVLGNVLKTWLEQLVDALVATTHTTTVPGLPTSPPVNAASFVALKAQIPTILSSLIKLSK